MRLLVFLCTLFLATSSFAQPRQRVEKAADLPQFSWFDAKVRTSSRRRSSPFAARMRRDFESVLAGYADSH
jgi:hypothetical protein